MALQKSNISFDTIKKNTTLELFSASDEEE